MPNKINSFEELVDEFVGFQKADRLHRERRTEVATFLHRVHFLFQSFSSAIAAEISMRIIGYLIERSKNNTFNKITANRIWPDYHRYAEAINHARSMRLILGKPSEPSDWWSSLFEPKYDYLLNPFITHKLEEEPELLTRILKFVTEEEPTRIMNALKTENTYPIVRWLFDSGEGVLTMSTAKETFMEPESTLYSAFEVLDHEKIIERPIPSVARPGPKFDEAIYAMLFSEYFVTKLDAATSSLRLLLFAMTPATIINERRIGSKASFKQIAKIVKVELNLPMYISSIKLFRPIVLTTDDAASALNLQDIHFAQRLFGDKEFETKEIFTKISMHKPLVEETKVGEALEKLDIVHNGIVPLNFEHLISTNENKLKCVELELTI